VTDAKSFKRPRLTNYPRLWRSRLRRNWPFLLWVGVLVFIAAFYSRNEQFGQMTGTVETIEEPIAPLETSRLLSVSVLPGQAVTAGQAVAQMDTALIDAEIAVQAATLREAQDVITGYQENMLQAQSTAQTAMDRADATLRIEERLQKSDVAELAVLKEELKRLEGLLARGLINEMDVAALRAQTAPLEQAVASSPPVLEVLRRQLDDARRSHDVLQTWMRMDGSRDISEAIKSKMAARNATIEANQNLFQRRKDAYTLRATRSGTVSRLLVQPGNVVNSGLPILTLVTEHPDYIVGFLPEVHVTDLRPGEKVLAWRQNGKGSAVYAAVESVSPDVMQLPGRVSPIANEAIRGRRVMLRIEGPHDFIPGETVEIHEAHTGWLAFWDRLTLFFAGRSIRSPTDRPPSATAPAPTDARGRQ